MANHLAAQLALRARLETLTVCETGLIDLSSTVTGYARPNGSFLDDGFAVGMEVTPTGFADTSRGMITDISALTMTIGGGRSVEAEAPSRRLSVGVPERVAYTNVPFDPTGGTAYIEEDYVPATSSLVGMPYDGGTNEDTGIYVIRWYTVAGKGLTALASPAFAVLALFKAGTAVTTSAGETIRVRGDFGPVVGPIRADTPGFAVITITIPWRIYTSN